MISKDFLLECQQYIDNGDISPVVSVEEAAEIAGRQSLIVDEEEIKSYMTANRNLVFARMLFRMIDKAGKKDSHVYKKAQMDRRLFSRIRSTKDYVPAKKTVISLCLAMELSRADTDKLLSSAGYSLSGANDFDLIIAFCIEKKVYNLMDVNEVLYHFNVDTI